jgi:Txe/YoeB family toxin of Txe-Axe toxin-antitoxin module
MEVIKGNNTSDLDEIFVEKLTIEIEKIYKNIDKNNDDINEINKIYTTFNNAVLPILEEKKKEASKYYNRREEYSNKIVHPVNEKVIKIIEELSEYYNKIFNDTFTTQIASSYSAKMNLIGESDIDYFILFDELTMERLIQISQVLLKYNFKFDKIGGKKIVNTYYIYNTFVNDIEVEFKVRDYKNSSAVRNLHDFIDNKLNINLKILFTYAKYQLKLKSKVDKSFLGYNYFKTIFYNYCFKDIHNPFLIVI